MPYLDNFGLEFENTIITFEISALEFQNFGAKMKILKFGTKNALFEYFWAGI